MPDYAPDRPTARADLLRFLSACFCEPSPMFAEERLFDSLATAAAAVDAQLGASARTLGESFSREGLQALLIDYTRLFIGAPRPLASPYGASWLDDGATLMSDSTADAASMYGEGGFDVDVELQDLPDHVAVELEFAYVLAFRIAHARAANDGAGLAALRSLQQRFLGRHLGAWIGRLAAAVRGAAETAFYRDLATLTEQAVMLQMRAPDDD